jgi:hypothetical protein
LRDQAFPKDADWSGVRMGLAERFGPSRAERATAGLPA